MEENLYQKGGAKLDNLNQTCLPTQFIEPEENAINPKQQYPASYLRKAFQLEKEVETATLSMTALGVYVGYLNGQRLGSELLSPGYTDYKYRVQAQTHDVTALLLPGENVLAALLGDGWYRGSVGLSSKRNCYGEKTKFACVLDIRYKDGSGETMQSDGSWKASQDGPLRENDLKLCEKYDARKELPGWNAPGFDDGAWHGVLPATYNGKVIPQEGEPVLEHEVFSPKVLHTPNGETVLDFGQNLAGYVEFTVEGPAGHEVKLTMGETLDEHGNFTMKNLVAEGSFVVGGAVGQELFYTLKEGKQTYKPFFHNCGFRYVKLENWCGEVLPEQFKSIAIYSDFPSAGRFECSNPQINQLVHNVIWSQKSNFVDIPGDCPTRERGGWAGDICVFSETACYLSDPRKFLKKWLADYMLEQSEDGNLPYIVPEGGYMGMMRGSSAWSDAISNISMMLYRFYGDEEVLSYVYDSVKRFVEFNRKRAGKKNPFLLFKGGKHRKYIIETGFHFGEWLEPGSAMFKDIIKDFFMPDTEVTTAWFYQTVLQLSEMAAILGKTEDEKTYRALAEQIRSAYHKEFLPDGRVSATRHCRYVRPIAMGLVGSEQASRIAAALDQKCIDNQYKIGTGFLTTYKVLPVLTDCGYTETAYKMLENTACPGWLYAVTKGATTTWENWLGIDENGVATDSLNHYAPGSVVAWLFAYCAGITPKKPGFAEVKIQPYPGGSLTWAKASYPSVKGLISSEWKREAGHFQLDIVVPEGIPCEVILPNGETHAVCGGAHSFTCEIA